MIASRPAGARYLIMVPCGEFGPLDIAAIGGREAVAENDVELEALADPTPFSPFRTLQPGCVTT
jgi:hypothetical protein